MLIEKIFEQAASAPLRTAFVHNEQACSYGGFARRIARACDDMAGLDLPAGSACVLCVENLAKAWVLGIALRHLGLVTVNLGRADQIGPLGLTNVSSVVTVGSEQHGDLQALAASASWRLVVAEVDGLPDGDAGPIPDLPAAAHPTAGHILLTSGTTGAHKMVLRDAQAEFDAVDLRARIFEIAPTSVVYVRDFPLGTAGGYRWPLATWCQGATVVFQQQSDFIRPFQRPGLTHALATPATLTFLLNPAGNELRRNDAMRLLVTGGAMSRKMASAARDCLSSQVFVVLASTEALVLGATLLEDLDDLPWHRIHPLREVQVVDAAGRVLPPGETGFVRARIQDGLSGYLGDEVASKQFFRDGWFYSGDLGSFRPDGRLALSGRVSDVINVLGNKIATGPIERELQDRLAVEGVCLIALPGPDGNEEVHVVIESRRRFTRAELERVAQGLLRGFGRLHFRFVAALPRNSMGKIERLAVRQQLLEGVQGS